MMSSKGSISAEYAACCVTWLSRDNKNSESEVHLFRPKREQVSADRELRTLTTT
jgi:hypothetical protein